MSHTPQYHRPRGRKNHRRSQSKSPAMSSESKLSKWQVAALGIGAAAVVAGGAIVAYACVKRRRRTIRDTTDPDATPTPQTASHSSSIGMPSETAATTIQPPSEQRVSTGLSGESMCWKYRRCAPFGIKPYQVPWSCMHTSGRCLLYSAV